jgi:hypothetical protein
VPSASSQVPWPLQSSAAVAQSGSQSPFPSLSWVPSSHVHAAVPPASSQWALSPQANPAVPQSSSHVPSPSPSWYPVAQASHASPVYPALQVHAVAPSTTAHVPCPEQVSSPQLGPPPPSSHALTASTSTAASRNAQAVSSRLCPMDLLLTDIPVRTVSVLANCPRR